MSTSPFRFEVDRKLDNRRVAIRAKIIKLEYTVGDTEIERTELITISKSGYCLDFEDSLSVNIDSIGTIINGRLSWFIYAYPDLEETAREELQLKLEENREFYLNLANAIPQRKIQF